MNAIGVDAGGSLVKISYEEKGKLHTKTYPVEEIFACINWLQILSPDAILKLTGGKSALIQSLVEQKIKLVDEFQATVTGTRYVLKTEKQSTPDQFIQVHIGTGTSIFYVTPDFYERLLGTGIGGGTFIGLGKLISGKENFNELNELAGQGNSHQSDLLIRDIYAPSPSPLLGSLTASNFGKANLNKDAATADHIASLVRMIGETLVLLATQTAAAHQLKNIVFTGSTLDGNQPLKELIASFQDILDFNPIFLEKGAYVGAIGALLDR
ncbi:type II pantothenate kinase [Lentibacillus populi]|uniref:Type II pantothenate kinase n=1 Tax=Lentibacillus populi TaxID=1827502 RepID=A0A9W5U1F1_9BACI|nr:MULTISPECIES: type II pantothenate kinase [Bacillaceae]GGB59987.1 type II pantothenate kinase [Lentibacillus populi]